MDTLRELFRYNAWATLRLLDHCQSLPPSALHETAPGTYGSVLATLVHLLAAEQSYLSRVAGEPASVPVREGMEPPLAQLRAAAEELAPRWQALLDRASELNVTMPPQPDGWPETPHAETLLMLQTLHHGNEHRAHVGSVLGVHGLGAPDFDGWSYWEATHLRR